MIKFFYFNLKNYINKIYSLAFATSFLVVGLSSIFKLQQDTFEEAQLNDNEVNESNRKKNA